MQILNNKTRMKTTMKTIKMRTTITKGFAIIMIIAVQACGGSKTTVSQNGDKRVSVPCSGAVTENADNYKIYVASSSSLSMKLKTSRERALFSAKKILDSNIKASITSFTKEYTSGRDIGNQMEENEKFQSLGKSLTEQELNDTRIVCEETYQKPDGKYETFVAIKISTERIIKGLKESAKLRQDFNEEKFNNEMEKELLKYKQKQGN